MMQTKIKTIFTIACLICLILAESAFAIRIKDMASLRGVRKNQLLGYGLVVGLNGTGDKSSTTFTVQGLTNMLNRMGVKVTPGQVKVKNVAAVMVTAELPPFARQGNRLDVTLSSMGDASSLAGGTLLITPLKGLDGKTYVVAQGPVSVGGFQAGGAAATVSKNHPTVGRIPRGGMVERELPLNFRDLKNLTINLHTPDFTTANRIARKINQALPNLRARAEDSATVKINMPPNDDQVGIMAKLENLEVRPDMSAKVVVDERTGTVVMGEAVRISTVAVASGALSISITEGAEVSQALPLAQGGRTVVTPKTQVEVGESKKALRLVKGGGVSIGEVVKALNALGATPRDLITILQAIKAAGALQAELEII
ncbi:flagellar basal body P-ring protein [Dethiosulfatarculus sandiegensis]|uniref:Flagellar P-ring protein n=2 Tax=Dethiosulfatarculus sandiegensis TaxID=1429043 RepID=A0A0D2J614_9BACT|nr:flagellar basal body P-ring protein FlgI [Dethiosulfatarculus sandiegensis]KIX13534.1 flagellar basal body P-ring protein [Dethiosulfatarculus sandiegensis]